jgi:hypothetical protein
MKSIVLTTGIALIGSICLGAEPPQAEEAPGDNAAIKAKAEESIHRAVEEAKRVSQKAVEHAQRALDMARSKLNMNESGEAVEVVGGGWGGRDVLFPGQGRGSAQPLIIRSSKLEPKAVANIQEDLTVMSRILNKAVEREVGREGREAAMGIVISSLPGSRRPQSIYLEGYGALFLLNVKFPLVEPPAKDDEKAERTTDTTWEQTRRELYMSGEGPGKPRVMAWDSAEATEYDADQVEGLTRALLESLKNAANIREVKPGEAVTITVVGTQAPVGARRLKDVTTRSTGGGNMRKLEVFALSEGPGGAARESVMTLRAKKADIDAFAKGELNLDQFRQRVNIVAY